MEGSLARRYATAFVESAAAQSDAALVSATKELEQFAKLIEESADLEHLLLSPVFTLPERQKALEALLDRLAPSQLTRRFVLLISKRNRFSVFEGIAKAVRRLADQRAGRMRAEVVAASPLSQDASDSLKRALEKRTGKHIEMDVKVDPSVLGGVRARIGSVVLDGTLRSQLEALRERLLRAE